MVRPFLNIGPGVFIAEEIEARGWRKEDLAVIMGMKPQALSRIINNRQPVTIRTARLLGKAFGQSPQFWLNLDNGYRLRLQQDEQRISEAGIRAGIYDYMPIGEMQTKGWVKGGSTVDDLKTAFAKFWDVRRFDPLAMDKAILPEFRKSEAFRQFNQNYAKTWFQMARTCARTYAADPYNRSELHALAERLNTYTRQEDGAARFIANLKQVGVKFFVLSHLQKTYIDGASFMDRDNPVVVYTGRHNRADNFWFTVAHELGHVLLHLTKATDLFLDNIDELHSGKEDEANRLAYDALRVKAILKYFRPLGKYISRAHVLAGSAYLDVSSAVIVGCLQHHGMLRVQNLNRLKEPVIGRIPQEYYPELKLRAAG
jgi:HTH-type transcriptional regulator/antitoxin HigA